MKASVLNMCPEYARRRLSGGKPPVNWPCPIATRFWACSCLNQAAEDLSSVGRYYAADQAFGPLVPFDHRSGYGGNGDIL